MTASPPCPEKKDFHAVACSAGIRALVHLPNFLGVKSVVTPAAARAKNLDISMVVVWGRKENSVRALEYASENNLLIRYLEDGWIRTASADAHSRRSYSLLVDNAGVYYDCSTPSEIENTLNLDDDEFSALFGKKEQAEALYCREFLVRNSITKYNYCRSPDPERLVQGEAPLVLIIDQTAGDASLVNGGMPADNFETMLNAARRENPDARLVVRTHPDVVSGRKAGHLAQQAKHLGLEISADGDNPIDWIKHASKVYVGTSQLGYEALLCGVEVHVFGCPFYAGWGLTVDRQKFPRRTSTRTIDELFYVCHMRVARYCHPISGTPYSLRECLQHVNLQKRQFQRNAHHFVGHEITLWKRRFLKQFLRSPDGSVRFANNGRIESHEHRLTWSFRDQKQSVGRHLPSALGSAGITANANASTGYSDKTEAQTVYRMEDGFLRSKGLGSDFVAPASLVVDSRGIYFDPSRPSDLEHLLQNHDCTAEEIARAGALIQKLLSAGVSKYNVEGESSRDRTLPGRDKKALLVIGQVADDESIRRGAVDIKTNLMLVEAARQANPDAYILFKPHPDVVSGNREGHIPEDIVSKLVDDVVADTDIVDCLNACHEVHTITSLSGFEALLRGKSVFTYGLPFYAGWGLTHDRHQLERRMRKRSLEELVHCTLVAYPLYMDRDSKEFIEPEDLIELLSCKTRPQNRLIKSLERIGLGGKLVHKAQNIVRAMTY